MITKTVYTSAGEFKFRFEDEYDYCDGLARRIARRMKCPQFHTGANGRNLVIQCGRAVRGNPSAMIVDHTVYVYGDD